MPEGITGESCWWPGAAGHLVLWALSAGEALGVGVGHWSSCPCCASLMLEKLRMGEPSSAGDLDSEEPAN